MLRTELIRPLTEMLQTNALRFGHKTAFADARRSVTWSALHQRTARVSGHLAGLGVQPAARVLLYLHDCVESVECYLAVLRAGGISAHVHTGLQDAELAGLLNDSKAVTVITDTENVRQVRRVLAAFPHVTTVLVDHDDEDPDEDPDEDLPLFAVLATTEPEVTVDSDLGLDDLAFLSYTAGTLESPRGVLFSQRNVMWAIAACYAPILGLGPEDRVCCPLPLAEGLAQQVGVIGVVAVGATGWIAASAGDLGDLIAQKSSLLNDLVQQRITFLAGMPSTYQDLLWAADGQEVAAHDLRICLAAGSADVDALREAFDETFGVELLGSYMTTETTGPVTVSWPTGRVEAAWGLPIPGVSVRVIDLKTGTDAGIGQEGEVWVSGPNVMAGGYHDQPGPSAAVISDGWYHTGDLAKRDALGYLTITGRLAEVIRWGGERLNPREIENVLLEVGGVTAAVAVGRPHPVVGEVPTIYLQVGADDLDLDEVFRTCRRLPSNTMPVELYRVEEIPRARAGRLARRALLDVPAELTAVLVVERGAKTDP